MRGTATWNQGHATSCISRKGKYQLFSSTPITVLHKGENAACYIPQQPGCQSRFSSKLPNAALSSKRKKKRSFWKWNSGAAIDFFIYCELSGRGKLLFSISNSFTPYFVGKKCLLSRKIALDTKRNLCWQCSEYEDSLVNKFLFYILRRQKMWISPDNQLSIRIHRKEKTCIAGYDDDTEIIMCMQTCH